MYSEAFQPLIFFPSDSLRVLAYEKVYISPRRQPLQTSKREFGKEKY